MTIVDSLRKLVLALMPSPFLCTISDQRELHFSSCCLPPATYFERKNSGRPMAFEAGGTASSRSCLWRHRYQAPVHFRSYCNMDASSRVIVSKFGRPHPRATASDRTMSLRQTFVSVSGKAMPHLVQHTVSQVRYCGTSRACRNDHAADIAAEFL